MRKEKVWEENGHVFSYFCQAHWSDGQLVGLDEYGKFGVAGLTIIEHDSKGAAYWGEGQQLFASDGTKVANSLVEWGQIVKDRKWSTGGFIIWDNIPNGDERFDEELIEAAQKLKLGQFS